MSPTKTFVSSFAKMVEFRFQLFSAIFPLILISLSVSIRLNYIAGLNLLITLQKREEKEQSDFHFPVIVIIYYSCDMRNR